MIPTMTCEYKRAPGIFYNSWSDNEIHFVLEVTSKIFSILSFTVKPFFAYKLRQINNTKVHKHLSTSI